VTVGSVGQVSQIRAGRQLTVADFTDLGLSAPLGLWNLSNVNDSSGSARNLTNKGAVPFGVGINGAAATAAVFSGATGQALYISDTGSAADPFRIRSGSFGCWFKTAKRGQSQTLVSKGGTVAGTYGWHMTINSNALLGQVGIDGSTVTNVTGVTDVADDLWHFGVITADGTVMRVYLDGVLEAQIAAGPVFGSAAPFNIGGFAADSGPAASQPHYGRIDEAFVTSDVLSEDQIRCLYAAKIAHGLGAVPSHVSILVHRLRKGAALVPADFSTAPLRLHNFTAASLTDQGSNNQPLGGSALGTAGADGSSNGAVSFAGSQNLSVTDTGLPAGLAARSYGCWFKTSSVAANGFLMAWGSQAGPPFGAYVQSGTGGLFSGNGNSSFLGPFVADGQWHQMVTVEDNAATDLVKRKLYLDGRLVGGATSLFAVTLGGADRFRIGANVDGTGLFIGQIDGVFITGYAMAPDEIARLYAKGGQSLGASPKNAGDHVERVDAAQILFIGDTLEVQHKVDLAVMA
jgi:hypothetical protein